jgi:L-2-hydroxyglutarate oxidase LhgO
MTNYVYSTLTCDNIYHLYAERTQKDQLNRIIASVKIKGGAGVAVGGNMNNPAIFTPQGVVTEVSDSDLEILKKNPVFIEHEKRGFLKVDSKKADANTVSQKMKKDNSAPKTPSELPLHKNDNSNV